MNSSSLLNYLSTALGMLNLYYPSVNKSQFAVTVFFGLVYGVIGTLIFRVYLDISLIAIVIYSISKMVINRRTIKEGTALSRI